MVLMPKKRKRSRLSREPLKGLEPLMTDPEQELIGQDLLQINPELGKCGQDLLM
jgi:hypothetical protein